MEKYTRWLFKFAGLLTILFIGLRIAHIVHFSWWWVFSPAWIIVGLLIMVILIAIIKNTYF